MAGAVYGRIKRINAEFRGDEAVEIDILEVALRMADVSRTRAECDTKLVRLALKALDRAIAEYCSKTAQRYPGYAALARFIEEREAEGQAEPARVLSMQK